MLVCVDLAFVATLTAIGTPRPESLYRFLQRILHQNGVDFIQAPYSAVAQVRWVRAYTGVYADV